MRCNSICWIIRNYWHDQVYFRHGCCTVYFPDAEDQIYGGVVFLVSNETNQASLGYQLVNVRIITICLKEHLSNINLVKIVATS